MTRRQIIALAVVILGAVYGLFGLWWWALVGMSRNVSLAWLSTTMLVTFSAAMALLAMSMP